MKQRSDQSRTDTKKTVGQAVHDYSIACKKSLYIVTSMCITPPCRYDMGESPKGLCLDTSAHLSVAIECRAHTSIETQSALQSLDYAD